MVAGSLIAGILYVGYAEMKWHKAEDFLLSLRKSEGYQLTPNSQDVYFGYPSFLVETALNLELAHGYISGHSRTFLLWGIEIGSFPIPILQQQILYETNGYAVYRQYDGTEVLDEWEEYADYCGYASLHYLIKGKRVEAEAYYQQFSAMWNGTGFVDSATLQENRFLTYKNAMFLFLTKKLQQTCPFIGEVEEGIWKTWDEETGGFHPYYTSTSISGEVHLEPTCWVLIAYNKGRHLLDS